MHELQGFSYLSEARPDLVKRLPRIALGAFPTPLHALPGGRERLYVKRDDASHAAYGGNKLRKLEYLFGRARRRGAECVATFGAAGSHHALATALHARRLNLVPLAFLCHQHFSPGIAAVLEAHRGLGTRVVYWGGTPERRRAIVHSTLARQPERTLSIPTGGSSLAGALGYVNAAFELAAQWRSGLAPVPARIYVALGTMGTVAGLAVGLAMEGLSPTIVAVRVVDEVMANERRLKRYCNRVAALLERLSSPPLRIRRRWAIELRHDQVGAGYAHPTEAAERAAARARDEFGLALETTYTAKAMAAMLADFDSGHLDDGPALFLNTYSGSTPAIARRRPSGPPLPDEFRRYFGDPASR